MGKKKDKQWWMRVDQEIAQLKLFNSTLDGQAKFKGKHIGAEIERVDGRRIFRLGTINDSLSEEPGFTFEAGDLSIKVTGRTTAQRNTVNVREGWASRYTEGIVEEFRTVNWTSRPGCFRSYYLSRSNQLLYQLFGNIGALDICLKGVKLRLVQEDHYIIVAALVPVAYEVFNELSYALLVALGFVSGEFLQNEVFSFRVKTANSRPGNSFHYRSLRKGGSSVYQALVWIPFGYEEMIGRPLAEKLYKNKTLIPLDIPTITELARQVLDDHHIKYALVLLNDANESSQSLLIRNNCFFIVMEVLRKTYYEQVKDQLPKDYSNRPHLQKFRNVFEAIAPITDQEAELLALRNTFMHGDIRNIEGEEMMRIMHRQLSLIYKLVLTHAGFRGYTIDHYFLRHGPAKKAFTKLIPGFAKIGVSTTDNNLEN
jgi:hypothetical protein